MSGSTWRTPGKPGLVSWRSWGDEGKARTDSGGGGLVYGVRHSPTHPGNHVGPGGATRGRSPGPARIADGNAGMGGRYCPKGLRHSHEAGQVRLPDRHQRIDSQERNESRFMKKLSLVIAAVFVLGVTAVAQVAVP